MEWQPITDTLQVAVDDIHRFGTDTLLLADFAAPHRGNVVLDMGTGCGAIALLLADTGLPAAVHGIDIAVEAIALAGASAFPLGEAAPCFTVLDWAKPIPEPLRGKYDLVVCNPPYFAPGSGGVSAHEARRIARHEQPDTLEAICRFTAAALKYGGRFCLCHRPERLPAVLAALSAAGLEPKKLQPVQHRPEEAPWLVLIEAKKGGKPGLTWLAPQSK